MTEDQLKFKAALLTATIQKFEKDHGVTLMVGNDCCGCTGGMYIFIEDDEGNEVIVEGVL